LRTCRAQEPETGQDQSVEKVKQRVYATVGAVEEQGFERMKPPQPGEWLHSFPESPQSFEDLQRQRPVRPTAERRTIVLQPLGDWSDEQKKSLAALREYAEVFFQLPARVAEPMELKLADEKDMARLTRLLPAGHRRGGNDRQWNAELILDKLLKPRVPADVVACFGITHVDLWARDHRGRDLNYVFGLGSLSERVGLYSLCRYHPSYWGQDPDPGDELVFLRRAFKVLNHEIGHVFGLQHCVFYRCSMNGSNSLSETDSAPIHFCPVCHKKLHWCLGYDAEKRFRALQKFYAEHKLDEEAEWIARRLARYKEAHPTAPRRPPDE
jgi:archaemetzincin